MKSYNHLFGQITSFDNLLLAARKAQKGKRFKAGCARFNFNLEGQLLKLQRELLAGSYRHGRYRDFFINDPKRRLISAASYRNRVVHHALCNVIEPLFDRSFIHDSYACRTGKGTHAAVDRYTHYARKYRYVLKCDIRKYFPSVDQQILLAMIVKKIRCQPTMALITEIVSSRRDHGCGFHFSGDNLFTPLERQRGLPIGNLTSQFFANLYLDGFDHWVKEELRLPYLRYVDDWVVFANDKVLLGETLVQMKEYLAGLRLRLHANKCRVYRVDEGVRFLGYRIFPDHRLLDKGNVLRARRRFKKLCCRYRDREISFAAVHQSIQSWVGHASHADTYRLRGRLLGEVRLQRGPGL